jgi:soluble cytochrome b562
MAKKSARREPDPDLEDEEIELESEEAPRKKGSAKLGKSTTGKRKSAEPEARERHGSSSVNKKALKDSGKRKSATSRAKRPSAEDDEDEDVTSSSARRKRAPGPKKKDNTVLIVSIISMTLLLIAGVIVVRQVKKPGPVRDEKVDYQAFQKLRDEGMTAFREFNKAMKDGNAALAKQKNKLALDKLQAAMVEIEKVLADKRDANGMLHKDYEGYEEELSQMAQVMVDLEKRGTQ